MFFYHFYLVYYVRNVLNYNPKFVFIQSSFPAVRLRFEIIIKIDFPSYESLKDAN